MFSDISHPGAIALGSCALLWCRFCNFGRAVPPLLTSWDFPFPKPLLILILGETQVQIPLPIGYGAVSIREAAEYSNIGINQMVGLLKQPNRSFVLYVGT